MKVLRIITLKSTGVSQNILNFQVLEHAYVYGESSEKTLILTKFMHAQCTTVVSGSRQVHLH